MTDSSDSTPTTEVHSLSGSSKPGAGRPAFKPISRPGRQPQIRPRNDLAELRMITARLVPLIKREHAIQRRIEMLEVHHLLPDQVERLHRVSERMTRRIERWTNRLIEDKSADLRLNAIKADAFIEMVISGWTSGGDELGQKLALSVCRGALALGLEAVSSPAEVDLDDADLLSLLAQHQAALASFEDAEKAHEVPYQAYRSALPPRPKALYWSACDRARPIGRERVPGSEGSWYYVYDADDIERMRDKPATTTLEHRRPAPWDPNDTIVRKERVPDEVGEARRLEIIAAWDSWETAQEAVIESTGLNAANDAVDAASEAMNAVEDAILATSPRTVEGLLAKARWIADKPRSDLYLTPLFRDLCAALPSDIPSSLIDDRALRDAVMQFREIEFEQLRLCSAYECDTDQIPGYEATEAPWRSALVQVADLPAQSWAGIIAKAEVIKTESVWHDRDLSESIGDSIAEDVLRLAGRSWDSKLNRIGLALPTVPSDATRAA